MNSDFKFQISDLRANFIAAVRAAPDLPQLLREYANNVIGLESQNFDHSYIEFLDEQIQLAASGPAWTERLKKRRAALAPYCNQPLIRGRVFVAAANTKYYVSIDPITETVVHCEEFIGTHSRGP